MGIIVEAKLNRNVVKTAVVVLHFSLIVWLGSWVSYTICFCVSCTRTLGPFHSCYCSLRHNSHKRILTNLTHMMYIAFLFMQPIRYYNSGLCESWPWLFSCNWKCSPAGHNNFAQFSKSAILDPYKAEHREVQGNFFWSFRDPCEAKQTICLWLPELGKVHE